MRIAKKWIVVAALVCSACAGSNENSHTTATTIVSPPARQVLKAEVRAPELKLIRPNPEGRPVLHFELPNGSTFREGEAVVIEFHLENVKLKGDGGEYRVRYFVDDDEMQWIDRWDQVWLTGWVEGKHTIRLELVGPDGWPDKNRDNIITREITITK
jgi:hypothetical protein